MILYMSVFFALVSIIQSFTISLGVGSSTLAIVNFFVAIADGKIDETERRMMGVVYVILRIAMVLILTTTILLVAIQSSKTGLLGVSAFTFAQLTALFVLYINAMLMTARLVPSTIGPSVQAGSWYTLGMLGALASLGLTNFAYIHFVMSYVTWLILATAIVNGVMAILKEKRAEKIKKLAQSD